MRDGECWTVTVFAGPESERDRFGDAPIEGHEQAAATALADLGLDWSGNV
jgi:hypothetical protein